MDRLVARMREICLKQKLFADRQVSSGHESASLVQIACLCGAAANANRTHHKNKNKKRDVSGARLAHAESEPLPSHLARRTPICACKHGSVAQALMALAEQTECDVRSCLHTLQFLSRRQRAVRPADVDAARVGQKDITKNAFSTWQELFWLRVRRPSAGYPVNSSADHGSSPAGPGVHGSGSDLASAQVLPSCMFCNHEPLVGPRLQVARSFLMFNNGAHRGIGGRCGGANLRASALTGCCPCSATWASTTSRWLGARRTCHRCGSWTAT